MKIKLILIILACFMVVILMNFYQEAVYNIRLNDNLKGLSWIRNKNMTPKICEDRVWEVNLSKDIIYFFENCELKAMFPIAHKSRLGKWYSTPTGYYRFGAKHKDHVSSYFNVRMDYAVQLYEDYFIHETPRFLNSQFVRRNFSAGCISLTTDYAKKFFNLAQTGDLVISYFDLDDIKVNKDFVFPVNRNDFYIIRRFNNPLRTSWFYVGNVSNLKYDYIQHAGLDLAPHNLAQDLNVYNIYDGQVVRIVVNGQEDHGLGNTVIIKHFINGKEIYSLYGHLESIVPNLKEGDDIKRGKIIGKVGATGYGCNYWRIGEDGCDRNNKLDVHLHWEIKTKPVLESLKEAKCFVNNKENVCYGYTPENPTDYGYFDPLKVITYN